MTVALLTLSERVLQVVRAANVPLTARDVTARLYPEEGGATKVRITNIRRILEDLTLDGLLARVEHAGRERVAWQWAA